MELQGVVSDQDEASDLCMSAADCSAIGVRVASTCAATREASDMAAYLATKKGLR